ncbi:MAG TPA: hypothetical protein VGJ73_08035 [Verrucomicrobiae bacterium]
MPANCPTPYVIAGVIVTVIGWPVTAWFAYRSGSHSQRIRIEWEAQQAKQSLKRKFMDSLNRFKTNVSVSENPDSWVDYFKDNVAQLISDYQTIGLDLKWKEKKKMDEAMNSIKRFAAMNEDEIRAACRTDTELFDALKKFPEA